MSYEKPAITFLQKAISTIKGSTIKGRLVIEVSNPHKRCTAPAYESDE